MAKTKTPHHIQIAEEMIGMLENGTAPYIKNWEPGQYQPAFNPTTGKTYRA